MARQTIASLQDELAEANNRVMQVRRDFESFKDRVRAEAIRVAQQQEWCDDGLNETLGNLDLEPLSADVDATIEMTITISNRALVNAGDVTREFIIDSLQGLDSIRLDSDWDSSNVEIETNVTELRVEGETR